MGMLEDMLKALDRFPTWKRLQGIPDEVDALKEKLAALEEQLGGKSPADICRFCGERSARLYHVFPSTDLKGNVRETWKCAAPGCGREDDRFYRPLAR
jgi:hypothetical protein